MDGSTFDALTRRLAQPHTRRRVLGMAAAAVGAFAFRGASPAAAGGDASALVQRFYELVDAYQYDAAYALLGAAWHGKQSLQNFTSGYGNTAFVQCQTTGERASGGKTTVGVKLISWHNDGAIVAYTGQYTVGTEGGQLLILDGKNASAAVPSGTPPLCAIADLALAFGAWQGAAGSRIGSIVAKNVSDATCVLGGSPRVTLTATDGTKLVSTSEEGSSPTAIAVAPGKRAHAPLSFGNWCGPTGNSASVRAEVPGDVTHTGRVSTRKRGVSYPPCNGPGQPATMAIKGWVNGSA